MNGRRPGALRARHVAGCGIVAASLLVVPSPAAGAAERPEVVPGQAKARAEGFAAKIQIAGSFADGGVALGIVQGVSAADSHDAVGSAEGRAIDYGLVDALNRMPTPECPDIVPLFDPATLPPITRADSDQPDGPTPRPTPVRFAGWPTAGPPAGVQDAVAGPAATGTGTTSTPYVDGGFLRAFDVASSATGTVGPDGRREAVAIVTAGRLELFGGAIAFVRPRFEARAVSGVPGTGSFTYEAVEIFGSYRSPATAGPDLAAATAAMEGLFGLLGVRVDWPKVEVTVDRDPGGGATTVERVVITPLRVRISNMPIGRDVIGPLLAALGPSIDEAMEAYLAQPCANQSLRLIVDVARGLVSGTGEAGVSFGGVEVETNDRWVATAELFDLAPVPTVAFAAPVVQPDVLGGVAARPVAPARDLGRTSVAAPIAPVVAPAAPVVAPAAPAPVAVRPRQVSLVPVTSRRLEPGSAGGAAVWAGLGVMAAIGALVLADRRAMRRTRRTAT